MSELCYKSGEVRWLLAEQAHRYQEDLSRLGDERDEAVAQHDRDAETIAELKDRVARAEVELRPNSPLKQQSACYFRAEAGQ